MVPEVFAYHQNQVQSTCHTSATVSTENSTREYEGMLIYLKIHPKTTDKNQTNYGEGMSIS